MVTRIDGYKVWVKFESPIGVHWFKMFDNDFRLVESESDITFETVRTVLKAYQTYSKMEYVPEYVHQEVLNLLTKNVDPKYQKYLELKKKFENS